MRGDSLDVSDADGLVIEVELLSEDETLALELSGDFPDGPTPIGESTLRIPFFAGAACTGGDSVEVTVDGGGSEPVTVTITSRDNGDKCDDMGVVRHVDVTFDSGVDIEAVRVVED